MWKFKTSSWITNHEPLNKSWFIAFPRSHCENQKDQIVKLDQPLQEKSTVESTRSSFSPTKIQVLSTSVLQKKAVMYPEFFRAGWYTHQTHKVTATIKICTSRYSKKCPSWLCLFLDFFVKYFPNYLILQYKKILFVDDF